MPGPGAQGALLFDASGNAITSIVDGTNRRLQTQTVISGTPSVNIASIPGTLPVSVQSSVSLTTAISNFPSTQAIVSPDDYNIAPANLFRQAFATTSGGTTTDMRVNGATTNVTYIVSADATKTITIQKFVLIISASALYPRGTYFAANTAALTNGILIQAIDGGVTTTLATLKTNEDLLTLNSPPLFDVSGTYDFLRAPFHLNHSLTPNSTDCVKFVVRDNLTTVAFGLTAIQAYAFGTKI